jgi:sulfide:quinone oxidoreductase
VDSVDADARIVHTVGGLQLAYEGLLVAVGGTPYPAFAHGIVFDRADEPARFDELLEDIEQGLVCDVAFVVPDAAGWTLPAYDLALILRSWARRHAIELVVRVVTAEVMPLECFGSDASRVVERVLERADIQLICGGEPILVSDTTMTAAGHWISVDRIVSLPRVAGPRLRGLPSDADGFLSVGVDGAVPGCPGVYGAGDGTAHSQKQGGLAAQQADLAARALVRDAGLHVPQPPRPPTLRGALATPDGPLFLEASLGRAGACATSVATLQPLWDPPGKVATHWLGRFVEGMTRRQLTAFAS